MKLWQVTAFVVVLLSSVIALDMMGLTKQLSSLDQGMLLFVPALVFIWLMQRRQPRP